MLNKWLIIIVFVVTIFVVIFFEDIFIPQSSEIVIDYNQPLKYDNQTDITILKIAHSFPKYSPQHRALLEKFIPIVQDGSDWKIIVEIYPSNQLGREEDYVSGVKNGTIEMYIGGKYLSQFLPNLKVINYPYLFDNYQQCNNILNGSIGTEISEGVNSLGMNCFGWNVNGFRELSILEDIPVNEINNKKLNIATISSIENIEILKAMGFSPLDVNVNNLNVLIRQRSLDGYESTLLMSYYNGFYKDVKNIFMTSHSIDTDMYLVSNEFLKKLTEGQKKLIKRACKESASYEAELMKDYEEDIISKFMEKGIDIKYKRIPINNENDIFSSEGAKIITKIKAEKASMN